jgi:hypothetical protein
MSDEPPAGSAAPTRAAGVPPASGGGGPTAPASRFDRLLVAFVDTPAAVMVPVLGVLLFYMHYAIHQGHLR